VHLAVLALCSGFAASAAWSPEACKRPQKNGNSYVYETGEETAARSVNAAVLLLCQSVLYYSRQSSVGRTKQVMRASLRTVEWAMVSTGWSKSDSPVLILR